MHKRNTQISDAVPQLKLLFSIDEAAAVLSLGRTLVYDLVMRDEIHSIKVGRMRRIPLSALQEYVARKLLELDCA